MKAKSIKAAKKTKSRPATTKNKREKTTLEPFPVVGIGASAGGVEASSEFLKNVDPKLGMAYVFVHHLSRSFDSHLSEILQRETSMPVLKVKDRIKIEANHVYVIPQDTVMYINEGYLTLRTRSKDGMAQHAIDHFFISLAHAYQHNAVGILLSGTATDGTLGLKSIKEQGGITYAQDESAKHSDMPTHAQEAGYVDYVLPAGRIAEELGSLTRHPYVIVPPDEALVQNEKEIKKILNIVFRQFGVDFFAHYKRTTVYRRIMRRMAVHKIEKFEQYIKKLQLDAAEVSALYDDFLINVTSFFREPTFYSTLQKTVYPKLTKNRKQNDQIRIWIPGCATGEEAYSTAISICEYLERAELNIPVQIFSTDLDEKAINKARLGIFSKNAMQQVSATRIKRFFTKIDGHYQVIKSLRDMCIFSVHNLMKDPPFSRLDLISCQNVLIYIEADPQRKILAAFHYGLNPGGFLLLGKSESIGNAIDLFHPVDKDTKLFTKKNDLAIFPRLDLAIRPYPKLPASSPDVESVHRTESDIEKESDKLLLTRYVPASVLVNKDLEILRFRGATAGFFQPASGKASLNLLRMLKEELVFELRALFQKVKKSNSSAGKEDIHIHSTGQSASIEITPIKSSKDIYFLIIFKENVSGTPALKSKKGLKAASDKPRIIKLEQALRDAHEQIRAITEDFDASLEELQSANEEILSSNEELQSINEELETSKEELQSSNEELTTINEELQTRLGELKQSRDYSEAIIETMRGPLLVLNAQMRVRKANKAFYEFFKVTESETEGSYLFDLGNGQWDIPALRDQLRKIFPKKIHFKDFEINHTFPGIGNRHMIVNAHRLIHGEGGNETQVLLAFEDITRHRQAEKALIQTQEQLNLALQGGSVGTWSWNIKTNQITGSKEQASLFGMKEGLFNLSYKEWATFLYPDDLLETENAVKRCLQEKIPLDIEFRIVMADKSIRWLLSKANTTYDTQGVAERMTGVNIDITDRKQAVEALQESENRFHTLSDNAPVMIWMSDADKHFNFFNKRWLSFTGRKPEEEFGEGWYEEIHPEDRELFLEAYHSAYTSKKEFKVDYRLRKHDGDYRWMMNHGIPRYTNQDTFIGYIGTCIDITERIDLEKQKDDFMGIASHELKTPVTSIKAYTQILQAKFGKANDANATGMLTRLDVQVDKLTHLINTLLDVARVQSGQMDYEEEFFDINEFIQEIIQDMQQTAGQHELVTQLNTDGKVFGDRQRIGQVLTNLISNAVKYSPDSNKVIVQTDREGENFIFSVQDFGIGVPKDLQEHVFGRFFRVSESSGNRVSGLGLGLYIASQIVKQQGGKIWLHSEPGKGSKFSFSMPIKAEE
jgi:two-component system CheB/CheR fusion protein